MLVEFSVVPLGKGISVSPFITRAMKIILESGVTYRANPMGTVLEGEWNEVMNVIRRCHDELMKDSDRVLTTIRIDDRKGEGLRIDKKIESMEKKLGSKLNR